MKRRLLFIIVYIILFPTFFVAIFLAFISMFIAPIVWIVTGDGDKAWDTIFGGIQGWIVGLPYKIMGEDD